MKIISEYPELQGRVFDTAEACKVEEQKVDKLKADKEAKMQADIKEKNTKKTALKAELEQLAKVRDDAREKFISTKKSAQETIDKANAEVAKAYAEFKKTVRAYNDKIMEYRNLTGSVHKVNVEVSPDELFRILFGIDLI